jgi:hypothetical protein
MALTVMPTRQMALIPFDICKKLRRVTFGVFCMINCNLSVRLFFCSFLFCGEKKRTKETPPKRRRFRFAQHLPLFGNTPTVGNADET